MNREEGELSMEVFFMILGALVLALTVFWLVQLLESKKDGKDGKQEKKYLTISIVAGLVILLGFSGVHFFRAQGNSSSKATQEELISRGTEALDSTQETTQIQMSSGESGEVTATTEAVDEQLEQSRKQLKEQYGIDSPHRFATGDTTGNWRIATVANGTAPEQYAIEYAKAYLIPAGGDKDGTCVYFIVNYALKTTTKIHIQNNILEVKTTEYVSGEERDAKEIQKGIVYSDNFYDLATGKQYVVESDESAGTKNESDFLTAVRDCTKDSLGKGEKITDISLEGKNLVIKIDMSGADTSIFPVNQIAGTRVGSVTDSILELGDSYYNSWDTITMEFKDIGSIVLKKSDVKDQGYGKFFEYDESVFD
jgi:hypothetical protein